MSSRHRAPPLPTLHTIAPISAVVLDPRWRGGRTAAWRRARGPLMPGVGGLPMPAFSSDDDVCPFTLRTTQLGKIGALRMRVGLRPDGLEDSLSRALPERRARKRHVNCSRVFGSSDELLEENDGSGGAGERGKLAT